jgi:hypothetical protein
VLEYFDAAQLKQSISAVLMSRAIESRVRNSAKENTTYGVRSLIFVFMTPLFGLIYYRSIETERAQ